MHIDEPRRHNEPLGLHDPLVIVGALIFSDLLDLAVLDEKVQHIVNASFRVNDPAVFNQDHRASSFRYS